MVNGPIRVLGVDVTVDVVDILLQTMRDSITKLVLQVGRVGKQLLENQPKKSMAAVSSVLLSKLYIGKY